ncbi:MAG: hypothetical protein SF029_12775 [bacterium]|nr:hypothetical protein [bacterium]
MHGDQHYQLNREYQQDMLRAARRHQLAQEIQQPQERGFWNRRLKREYTDYEAETNPVRPVRNTGNGFIQRLSGIFRASALPGDITQTQELTPVK